MNQTVFTTLEFAVIRERLRENAMSYLGRARIDSMEPSTDVKRISGWLSETEEALGIILNSSVPIPSLDGMEMIMGALNKGIALRAEQMGQVGRFLDGSKRLKEYMVRKLDVAPKVAAYASAIVELDELREQINESVQYGEVMDSASDELARVRKQIVVLADRVRRKVEAALVKYKSHLQEPFYSQRLDRFVLPIKRESKRLVKGSILDESASGQTVYIEPAEVSAVQEELSELRFAETREVEKVLSILTGWIEDRQEDIRRNLEVIGHYDFLFAKAKLAKAMDAISIDVNSSGRIVLRGARHPLLETTSAKPIDFHIGRAFKALIITGPNTGGKTVALKTVGLLTIMMQCGLLVPVDKGSELSVYDEVLADIGDGQSMDESLSTFSAHVRSLIGILNKAGLKSLVLLDELASGTDPGEGIGLSIAVLESLHKEGATIVATTHFNEIKRFAADTPGFENARMEFDTETLQPLYQLRIGEAGESYALVIAEKLGVPADVVSRARALARQLRQTGGAGALQSWVGQVPQGGASPAERATPDAASQRIDSAGAAPEAAPEAASQRIDSADAAPDAETGKSRGYLAGDRVWIHPLKRTGIYVGPADERGNVVVLVKKQRIKFNHKRIAPYLTREELYPDSDSYDLDIVLESKSVRKKRKVMSKRHVEGLSIEYPSDGDDGRKR